LAPALGAAWAVLGGGWFRPRNMRRNSLLAACGILIGLSFLACRETAGFVQLVATAGPSRFPAHAPREFSTHGLPSANAPGSTAFLALMGVVGASYMARQRARFDSRKLAGLGLELVAANNSLTAQIGDADLVEAPTALGGIIRRHKHVSARARCGTDRNHTNNGAKSRFIVDKKNGLIWRKQWGLRHLKSKKPRSWIRKRKKLVVLNTAELRRACRVLNIPIKSLDVGSSAIMVRKYKKIRDRNRHGTFDNVVRGLWGPISQPKDIVPMSPEERAELMQKSNLGWEKRNPINASEPPDYPSEEEEKMATA